MRFEVPTAMSVEITMLLNAILCSLAICEAFWRNLASFDIQGQEKWTKWGNQG